MKAWIMLLSGCIFCLKSAGQSIGVGTSNPHPSALVHISLSSNTSKGLLVNGNVDVGAVVPDLGAGSRLTFFPGKAAFRAGYVVGSQWDNSNTGAYSFAGGYSTTASGMFSTAFGINTSASGLISSAFGENTHAQGNHTTALGHNTIARGYGSTVVGINNWPIVLNGETVFTGTTPLFIVGNGNAADQRSNAFVVRKDGRVGIGSDNPSARLSIAHNEVTAGGLSVNIINGSNTSAAVSVNHGGEGAGIMSSASGGNALWGIASSISYAGVIGDNTYGEAIVGRNKGGNGVGAVVGRNDSAGYGVRGFNTKMGIGVLGQSGISGGTGRAGVFENFNSSNPSNALEANTNGSGAAAFFTNTGSGAALVTGSGEVGIGTTTPAFALDVVGRMRLAGGGDAVTSPGVWLNNLQNTAQVGFFGVYNNDYMGWYGSNGASWNLMMNVSNGYIGIGTQNPSQKLHVNGNICYTGSIAACSDIRFKTNISPLQNVLPGLLSLQSIYYHWDKDQFPDRAFTTERQLGFSAQEVRALFPELVQTDPGGYMAVDYGRLTPILVQAMKEQQVQLDHQQQQINELLTANDRLLKRLEKLEQK